MGPAAIGSGDLNWLLEGLVDSRGQSPAGGEPGPSGQAPALSAGQAMFLVQGAHLGNVHGGEPHVGLAHHAPSPMHPAAHGTYPHQVTLGPAYLAPTHPAAFEAGPSGSGQGAPPQHNPVTVTAPQAGAPGLPSLENPVSIAFERASEPVGSIGSSWCSPPNAAGEGHLIHMRVVPHHDPERKPGRKQVYEAGESIAACWYYQAVQHLHGCPPSLPPCAAYRHQVGDVEHLFLTTATTSCVGDEAAFPVYQAHKGKSNMFLLFSGWGQGRDRPFKLLLCASDSGDILRVDPEQGDAKGAPPSSLFAQSIHDPKTLVMLVVKVVEAGQALVYWRHRDYLPRWDWVSRVALADWSIFQHKGAFGDASRNGRVFMFKPCTNPPALP